MEETERVLISDELFFQEGPGVRNTQYTSSGVKLLNVANLVDGKIDLSTSDRYISEEEAHGRYKHFLVEEGDFIVASSGIKVEYIDKKMGFADSAMLPLCMNTSTIRFKVLDSSRLSIRYFMYFMKSQDFKRQLRRQITGSAQLNYGPSHLKEMTFPLINKQEQDRIVGELDKVAQIIEKRKAQIGSLDELIKARFVEMFDGHYREDSLLNLCNIIDYRGKTPQKVDGGLPFITAKNVKMHQMVLEPKEYISKDTYDKVMVRGFPKEGDVVFTTEAPLGNVCRIPHFDTEFYIGQRIVTLQTDKLDPIYLEYALSTEDFRRKYMGKSSGSTVTGIRVRLLEQLTIPVPPEKQQKLFAEFVHQVDKSKVAEIRVSVEIAFLCLERHVEAACCW